MAGSIYAGDLARDLGFKGMTPAFWRWCETNGIKGEYDKPFRFDAATVESVICSLRLAGALPKQRRKGGRK